MRTTEPPGWPPPAFFTLHSGMPREGPGTDEVTRRAIGLLPALPDDPVVLDLACGPGGQTLVLASTLGVAVVAVDIHEPFVEDTARRAREAGLDHLIEARLGDMAHPEAAPESVHLIWCEGAIYHIGFTRGLELWRPLLAPGGVVAVSEAVWTRSEVPNEARRIWESEYPDITDVPGCVERARGAGYDVLHHFLLEPADWWTDYYGPLEERVAMLRPRAASDHALAEVLDEAEEEMFLHRRFGDCYSYVFLVLRK